MSTVRYVPGGDWFSVVRAGVVVLLPDATAPDAINRLWDQLGENPNLQAILPIVAGGFGQGLESMPPFGLVSYTDRLHVLLRGDVRLTVVDDDAATVELSGEHVTTWTERIFDGNAYRFALSAGAAAGSDGSAFDAASALPLEAGIVRASGVRAAPENVQADPERAVTGSLEAEELATMHPTLYLADTAENGETANTDDSDDDRPAPAVADRAEEQPEPDPELDTTGYDHLWDQTVMRRVEDAAVRPPEQDDTPQAAPDQGPDAAEQHAESVPEAGTEADAVDLPAVPPSPSPEPAPFSPSAPGELIDSVPWARKSSVTDQAHAAPASSPMPTAGAPSSPAPAPSASQDHSHLDSDDHDGQTIMRSDLQGSAPQQAQPASEARPGTGPLVLARLCAQGHANPPEAPACGMCSAPLDGEPREVARPSLGTMRLSTGEVVELDRSLIIGRQPSVSRVQGRGMPKLVQVTSAGGDISRSHVEVRLDGWHVQLCDLKATNGTVLIRPGQPPRRLGEGETAFLLDGDVAQLGDDVFLRFEGLR